MAQKDVEIVQTTIRIPRELYEAAKACADDVYQSFNQFAIQAIAQRQRNWEHPVTREKIGTRVESSRWRGWVCHHAGCDGTPAEECEHREAYGHQKTMFNMDVEDGLISYADYHKKPDPEGVVE